MNLDSNLAVAGSHAGEDEWLLRQFPEGFCGKAVELGAHDGKYLSNTWLLEQRGWKVLCIEPNPRFHESLSANRELVLRCACDSEPRARATINEHQGTHGYTLSSLCDQSGWISSETTVLTLDQCLMITGFDGLDALSLDVDGIELDILRGLDWDRWRPKALVLECSGGVLLETVLAHGYQIDCHLGHNDCLVRKAP